LSSNIVDFVRAGRESDRKDINAILAKLQDLQAQEPEDAALQERIILSDAIRKRSTTVTSGAADQIISNSRDRDGTNIFQRVTPAAVDSYPLVHVSNSFSGITFPANDTKFGGRMDFDGTGFIRIDDNSFYKVTDQISILMWLYLPTNAANKGVIIQGFTPDETYGFRLTTTTDQLSVKVRTNNGGGTNYAILHTYTPNTWFHVAMTWKGTTENRLRLYIDKVQQGSDTTTAGALQYAGSPQTLSIGARDSGIRIPSGSRMAHLAILHDELTQTQIDNHFDGFLDTDANEEILVIPFVGDETEQPEATTNYCKSS